MESTIFNFVLRHSKREQVLLLVLTIASFPFFYLLLYLPKVIVNEAIDADTSVFPVDVLGLELGQFEYLMALCATFLALVLVNGGFKYFLNVYRGVVGERMLRRLRYDLFVQMLRFPLPRFRRTSQGELVSMIVAETEPLGGYIGDSIALPAFQGGMLITLLIFMFIEDPVLGAAAIVLYPVQAWLIPKLQRKLNAKKKERVRLARALSERIGEVVTGIREVHTHDTSRLERADFTERVGDIYRVRVQIYRLKFFIKFVNNFIAQITPFFFYSIGGYLVIEGDLTFGSLVAVIAAYEKLADPWKELLNFYQIKEDAKGKYELLLESFELPDMLDRELIDSEPEARIPIAGALVASNLDLKEEDEGETTFAGGALAPRGSSLAARDRRRPGLRQRPARTRRVAGLKRPSGGKLLAGGVDLIASPEAVTGRRIAYVGPETSLFSGTLRDNLLYSVRHRPTRDAVYDVPGRALREKRRSDAAKAGNSLHDIRADWIDYEGCGRRGHRVDERPYARGALHRGHGRGHLPARTAVEHRSGRGAGPRPRRAASPRDAPHPACGSASLAARGALRSGCLQHQHDGGREPSVRHAARPHVRPRGSRRQRLRAQGADRRRPARGFRRDRAAGGKAHDRSVRGRGDRQRAVRAVQLHLCGRSAGVPQSAHPYRVGRSRRPR